MQDSRPFAIYQTICTWPRVDRFVSTYFRYRKFRLQSKRGNPTKETLELEEKFQATPRKSNTSSFSNLPLLNLYPQPACGGTDPLSRLPMELISSQPVLMQKSHFNVLATSQNSNFICRDALKSQIKDQSTHIYLEGKKSTLGDDCYTHCICGWVAGRNLFLYQVSTLSFLMLSFVVKDHIHTSYTQPSYMLSW